MDKFYCHGKWKTKFSSIYSRTDIRDRLYGILKDYVEEYYAGTFINKEAQGYSGKIYLVPLHHPQDSGKVVFEFLIKAESKPSYVDMFLQPEVIQDTAFDEFQLCPEKKYVSKEQFIKHAGLIFYSYEL